MQPEAQHPYLRDGWQQMTSALEVAAKPILPDVNPADAVVRRMKAKLVGEGGTGTVIRGIDGSPGGAGEDGSGGGNGSDGGSGSSGGDGVSGPTGPAGVSTLTSTVQTLTSDMAAAQASITTLSTQVNDATISAVCNGDGTITVTLTWGS